MTLLYATNFRSGMVEAYDVNFAAVASRQPLLIRACRIPMPRSTSLTSTAHFL